MIKVILNSDVEGLGNAGEVVEVSDGYARNYLLPKNKASRATRGALANAESVVKARVETVKRLRQESEDIAKQLVGTRVVIAGQAGDEGRLFGSIGTNDVVAAVQKFTGVELDRRNVHLETPIKTIGLHEVKVRLHPEVEFPLTLDVIPA